MVQSLWWVPVLATALASVWAVPPWCETTLVGSGSFSMTADQYTNDIYNCTLELAASPGHLVCSPLQSRSVPSLHWAINAHHALLCNAATWPRLLARIPF